MASQPEIVVNGHIYRDAAFLRSGVDQAPNDPNPSIDPNGPRPEDPNQEHTDRSDLEGSTITVTGLQDTSNFYITVRGHTILVTVSNTFFPVGSSGRMLIANALGRLLMAYQNGPQSLKDRIDKLDKLVFADVTTIHQGTTLLPGRSASDEPKRTFYYDFDEMNVSPNYIASNIYHDAGHIELYLVNNNLYESRGVAVEHALVQSQINTATLFGLNQTEVDELNRYQGDEADISARAGTRPNP